MLDVIDTGGESDVDSILNDSDTKFVSDKPITKMIDDTHDIPVPEANIHTASELTEPQREHCKVLRKKRKFQLIYGITWSSRKTYHPRRDCTLQACAQHDFGNSFTPVDVFMKVENAQELTSHIDQFLTNNDELKAFLGLNYLLGINKLHLLQTIGKLIITLEIMGSKM